MCPEKANVLVVENKKAWQLLVRSSLEAAGHTVVDLAQTLEEALTAARKLKESEIQVVTVDGDLGTSVRDGKAVIEAIRTHAPGVKIVGVAGSKMLKADANVTKGRFSSSKLAETVNRL